MPGYQGKHEAEAQLRRREKEIEDARLRREAEAKERTERARRLVEAQRKHALSQRDQRKHK